MKRQTILSITVFAVIATASSQATAQNYGGVPHFHKALVPDDQPLPELRCEVKAPATIPPDYSPDSSPLPGRIRLPAFQVSTHGEIVIRATGFSESYIENGVIQIILRVSYFVEKDNRWEVLGDIEGIGLRPTGTSNEIREFEARLDAGEYEFLSGNRQYELRPLLASGEECGTVIPARATQIGDWPRTPSNYEIRETTSIEVTGTIFYTSRRPTRTVRNRAASDLLKVVQQAARDGAQITPYLLPEKAQIGSVSESWGPQGLVGVVPVTISVQKGTYVMPAGGQTVPQLQVPSRFVGRGYTISFAVSRPAL